MRLVLYSGGYADQNKALDDALLELTDKRSDRIKMTFIPSSSHRLREQFAEFFDDFRRFGVRSTFCLPIDHSLRARDLQKALRSDIIYLGGGNTFYFLHHLRKRRLLPLLKQFAHEGGVLAGLSAGAILLTPSIVMASIPKRTADLNEMGIKNLKAMNLVSFEFHPHYQKRRWENAELQKHSSKIHLPIYACPDGAGILVKDKKTQFLGPVSAFIRGKRFVEIDRVE